MNKFDNIEGPYGVHVKISHLIGRGKKVLDVGCGTGYFSRILSENHCDVVGLDINPKFTNVAKRYCKDIIVGDVETIDLPLEEGYFDVILFADVLEHLKDPLAALKKFKRYLAKDGIYIASIPNVANWQIRLSLLFGRWEYRDAGLLDRSHLIFFTVKSAKKMISDAGFQIIKMDVTPSFPMPFLYNFKIVQYIRYQIAKIWNGMFALQIIIVALKKC